MLNVNSAIYSSAGIDVNNVAKISGQILKGASQNTQPTVQAIDYSKFNRAALGIDLYSSRTSIDLQKQISLTQAGLYAKSIDIAQLNSKAAASLYSAANVQKNVELTQSAQFIELEAPKKLEAQQNNLQIFNTSDKNSNSSNGFNPFRTDEERQNKEESEKSLFNLFA